MPLALAVWMGTQAPSRGTPGCSRYYHAMLVLVLPGSTRLPSHCHLVSSRTLSNRGPGPGCAQGSYHAFSVKLKTGGEIRVVPLAV
jgi:hypothetical protein